MMVDYNAAFYTCSLIEYIGRERKLTRREVVRALGDSLSRIYSHADVFHCEPVAQVVDDFVNLCQIPTGDFDNVAKCRYTVPSCWEIGAVFARLVEDVADNRNPVEVIREVYESWISDAICRFNTDLYYQSRQYLADSYRKQELIAA